MKNKFGMPSLIEFKSIEENAKLCRELGLDFIELNMDLPYCLPSNNDRKSIVKIQEEYKVEFTIHFPEEIDFATLLLNIRKANIELFDDMAKWASENNIKLINLHLSQGVYFTLPDKKVYIYKDYFNEYMENLKNSFEKIAIISKKYGITTCVENTKMTDYIVESFENLSKMEEIFFTWDVGHDAKNEYKAKKFFEEHKEKVAHMHLHDSNGKDDHMTLLTGTLDVKERLRFAERNGITIVIETKTKESLMDSVKVLKSTLDL